MVQHDVAPVARLAVEKLQLQRVAGDVGQRMDNQFEPLITVAAPDRDFLAIGEQAQPDPLIVAAGDSGRRDIGQTWR